MGERAEIYLLLPVSNELECDNEPLYLNRVDILSGEDIDLLCNKIAEKQSLFSNENYYGYFDSKNLDAYLYPVIELGDDCYPSKERTIRLLMSKWGEDWRKSNTVMSKNKCFNCDISDDTLSLVAEKKKVDINSTFLILDYDAIKNSDDIIVHLAVNGGEIEIDRRVLAVREIANWFIYNRRPVRVYNHNDKHGENGTGQKNNKGEIVSVLRCSIEEAAAMLHLATKVEGDNKPLYYFDKNYSQYIVFKCDNYIQQSYHAYHTDNEDEVPEEVKRKLRLISNDTL